MPRSGTQGLGDVYLRYQWIGTTLLITLPYALPIVCIPVVLIESSFIPLIVSSLTLYRVYIPFILSHYYSRFHPRTIT